MSAYVPLKIKFNSTYPISYNSELIKLIHKKKEMHASYKATFSQLLYPELKDLGHNVRSYHLYFTRIIYCKLKIIYIIIPDNSGHLQIKRQKQSFYLTLCTLTVNRLTIRQVLPTYLQITSQKCLALISV